MRVTASGGTDAGNIVLFWPENLPEDADAVARTHDIIPLIDQLRKDGKLIWFICDGGDGGFSVAIYVRTAIPEALARLCQDEDNYPKMTVKGDGYFGGLEYIFKRDSSLSAKFPGMLEKVAIPQGTYTAKVYRTAITDVRRQSWLGDHVGKMARLLLIQA